MHYLPRNLPILALGVCAVLFAQDTVPPAQDPPLNLDPYVVREIRPLEQQAELGIIEPRFGAAVVADGDFLYIIGGSNTDGVRLDSIERFDIRTGRAERWGKLRIPRRHHGAVLVDGRIHVLGGTSGMASASNPLKEELSDYYSEDPLSAFGGDDFTLSFKGIPPTPTYYVDSMEIVDLHSGESRLGPSMPFAKALFGCVAIDNRIYVIGGQKMKGNNTYTTNTVEVFDIALNSWSHGVNMPTPRRCSATLVDGYIVVLGGYRGGRAQKVVEAFNPREKIWRRLPELTESVNPTATVWVGNYIFLFGEQNARLRQLVYDLRSKRLVPYPFELPESNFVSAVSHHGLVYLVGGADLRSHFASTGVRVLKPLSAPVPVGVPPTH